MPIPNRFYGIDPVFNYGCIPQTWEDPTEKNQDVHLFGTTMPIWFVRMWVFHVCLFVGVRLSGIKKFVTLCPR